MIVRLNGSDVDVAAGASVAEVVAGLAERSRGVAAAVNGEVVPRSQWDECRLQQGDRVEVVAAVGGG